MMREHLRPPVVRTARWSVRTRLSLIASGAAIAGLTVASVVAYVATSAALAEEVDRSFQASPVAAADGVLRLPPASSFCGNAESDLPSLGLYSSQLVRPDGTRCAATGAELVLPDDPGDLAAEPGEIVIRDGIFQSGAPARIAEVRLPDGSVVVVGRDLTPLRDVLRLLAIALVAVVVLGGIAAWFASNRAVRAGLRPVTRFVEYAEAVAAAGSLQNAPPLPPPPAAHNDDELNRLARSLDAMMQSLGDAQDRLHRLVVDAGHELRTPLASVRNNVALLRRSRRMERPLPPRDEELLLRDLEEETIELAALIDDVAQLTTDHESPAPTSVVRFDHCVERALRRAGRRGRDHSLDVELEPWQTTGDAAALERAAVNLLDNALKFSPPGTTVRVRLEKGTLSVADQGVGVTEDEGNSAFERFWRAPGARSQPGSGLGLSIVAEAARLHGGAARLVPREGGGCVAVLTVPGHVPQAPPAEAP